MITVISALMAGGGFLLACWSRYVNPDGAKDGPRYIPHGLRTTQGPYRWLTHPMYVGSWFMITGFAGLAAGVWNMLAVGTVAELLFREWAWRERGV